MTKISVHLLLLLTAFSGPAFATWDLDADIGFTETWALGTCTLIMTPEEPFSHYNSVCDLEEVVTLLDREQESGEQIGAGYPRTVVVYEVSNVQQHSYTPDTVHCVRFYDVILGHHSNSDLDEELDDLPSQCCVSPENGEIN